jgi:hypothetical protein
MEVSAAVDKVSDAKADAKTKQEDLDKVLQERSEDVEAKAKKVEAANKAVSEAEKEKAQAFANEKSEQKAAEAAEADAVSVVKVETSTAAASAPSVPQVAPPVAKKMSADAVVDAIRQTAPASAEKKSVPTKKSVPPSAALHRDVEAQVRMDLQMENTVTFCARRYDEGLALCMYRPNEDETCPAFFDRDRCRLVDNGDLSFRPLPARKKMW